MFKMSLKVKITRLVVLLVTGSIIVFGLAAYMPLRSAMSLQEQMFLSAVHHARAKNLQGMFSDIDTAMSAMAGSEFLRAAANDKEGMASRYLRDAMATHRNNLSRLMVVDTNGNVLASNDRAMVGRRIADVWRGNDLNDRFLLSSDSAPALLPFADRPTLAVGKTFEGAGGGTLALVGYLNWPGLMEQHLVALHSEGSDHPDGNLMILLNARGAVVGSSSRGMSDHLWSSSRPAEHPADLGVTLDGGQWAQAGSMSHFNFDGHAYEGQRMEISAPMLGHEVTWSLVTARDEAISHQNLAGFSTLLVLGGLIVSVLCGLVGYMSASQVSRAVLELVPSFEQLAQGNLMVSVQAKSGDEVETIGRHFNGFVERLRDVVVNIVESTRTLSESSQLLADLSQNLVSNAQETSSQAGAASKISDEVSTNINTVSAGVEEMSLSINEIARSSDEAARVATSAVRIAEMTNTTVAELGGSSSEIGNVIKVINSIAEQTNLLALNATIEAARAGEAGKGFAVVANEVKELAKETARATEDIGQKIEAIQAKTKGAVNAIGEIGSIINQVNDYQTTIASAVQEQLATTTEIGRNIAEVAERSYMITKNISTVAQIAQSASTGATETQVATSEVARISGELHSLVDNFRYTR